MDIRVLGPLEVRIDREPVALGGPRPRAVLADLIVHLGTVVSTDRLIDDLWGSEPPATAQAVVQNAIARLRKSLGATAIARVGPGYVLTVDPGSIDGHRFERLVRDARPLPPAERARALHDALALWRGPPFTEFTFATFLDAEIERLDELRLVALELRLEAEIELGLYDAAAAELAALAAQEPVRERLRRLQMVALHRSGRTQEALDVYEQTRHEDHAKEATNVAQATAQGRHARRGARVRMRGGVGSRAAGGVGLGITAVSELDQRRV